MCELPQDDRYQRGISSLYLQQMRFEESFYRKIPDDPVQSPEVILHPTHINLFPQIFAEPADTDDAPITHGKPAALIPEWTNVLLQQL